jgi:hypothetical protein
MFSSPLKIYLYFFICIFINSLPSDNKTIILPLRRSSELIQIKTYLFSIQYLCYLSLNTQSDKFITVNERLSIKSNPHEIQHISQTNISFYNKTFQAEYNKLSQWTFDPSQQMINDYEYYYLINSKEYEFPLNMRNQRYTESIPLSFISMKNKILPKLMQLNLIDYNAFTLIVSKRYNSKIDSKLIIGKPSNNSELIYDKPFTYTVPIINQKWICKLDKVIIQPMNYAYKDSSLQMNLIIQSGTYEIFVPKKFFDVLVGVGFKDLIERNECFASGGDIRCTMFWSKKIPELEFVIGNRKYPIKYIDLLEEIDFVCYYLVELNRYDNENDFIVGLPFLEKYSTLFDVDKEEMTFYSEVELEKDENNNYLKINILFCILVLLSGNGILLLYMKMKSVKYIN